MSQKQDNLIVVLDIGSAYTRVLAADLNEGSLRYRGYGQVESAGMRKGLIGELGPAARAVKAANEQAEAQYRSTVVAAFQNVSDTLFAIRSDADALAAAQTSADAAAKSLAIAQRQLALGDIPEVAVLNAQQTVQQAQIAVASAQAGRYADTVALFQALGGGWWNRQNPLSR